METEPIVGFKNDSSYYYITLPKLDENDLPLVLPYEEIPDSSGESYYDITENDTIFSDWFKVENEAELNYKCLGLDTSRFAMKIHKQATNDYIDLTLPDNTSDTIGVLRDYTLINGQGSYYRLEFTRKDTSNRYNEILKLDPLPVSDTVFGRRPDNTIYIDLNGQTYNDFGSNKFKISLHPNPTNQNIYATVYLPSSMFTKRSAGKVILSLFNTLGVELYHQEVKPAQTIDIPVSHLSNGIYYIRAEEKIGGWLIEPLAPAIEPFVIER